MLAFALCEKNITLDRGNIRRSKGDFCYVVSKIAFQTSFYDQSREYTATEIGISGS